MRQTPEPAAGCDTKGMTATELQTDQIQNENQELKRRIAEAELQQRILGDKLAEAEFEQRVLANQLEKVEGMFVTATNALAEERKVSAALRQELNLLTTAPLLEPQSLALNPQS